MIYCLWLVRAVRAEYVSFSSSTGWHSGVVTTTAGGGDGQRIGERLTTLCLKPFMTATCAGASQKSASLQIHGGWGTVDAEAATTLEEMGCKDGGRAEAWKRSRLAQRGQNMME